MSKAKRRNHQHTAAYEYFMANGQAFRTSLMNQKWRNVLLRGKETPSPTPSSSAQLLFEALPANRCLLSVVRRVHAAHLQIFTRGGFVFYTN